MPLPRITYNVDVRKTSFEDEYLVIMQENGRFSSVVETHQNLEAAKEHALRLNRTTIAENLFQGDDSALVEATRAYFEKLLEILPQNGDTSIALNKVREAYAFARTAILLDGLV